MMIEKDIAIPPPMLPIKVMVWATPPKNIMLFVLFDVLRRGTINRLAVVFSSEVLQVV
jgi:hypothetical protein